MDEEKPIVSDEELSVTEDPQPVDVAAEAASVADVSPKLAARVKDVMDHGTVEGTWDKPVDVVVEDLLTRYAIEIISSMFPSPIDGLKSVQRRMFWVSRRHRELRSSAVNVGEILTIHPYGDTSAYDVLTRMSQKWYANPPLVFLKGITGSYSGKRPAAMRYTKSVMADVMFAIFFDGGIETEAAIPKHRGITNEFEPQYLVPKIPTALVYDTLTIGFGYQCRTASIAFENVCYLTHAFAQHMDKNPNAPFDLTKHAKRFIPDFPTPCVLINEDALLKAYANGQFTAPIVMDGRVIISHNTIILQSLPHHLSFSDVQEKLEEAIKAKLYGFDTTIDRVLSLSKKVEIGQLTITIKRGVNVFDVWMNVAQFLKFTGTITPIPNYAMPNGRIVNIDPVNIIRNWFTTRRSLVLAAKRRKIQSLTMDLWTTQAMLLVVSHRDEVIEIIKPNTRETAKALLCERFSITDHQASAILAMKLEYISQITNLELVEKKTAIEAKIDEVNLSFRNVNQEIGEAALQLQRQYRVERSMHIPHYIGYVRLSGGYEQFESIDEALEIADRFPKGMLEYYTYSGKKIMRVTEDQKLDKGHPHRYGKGDIYSLTNSPSALVTISIENDAACCVKGVVPATRDRGLFYTTPNVIGITRRGEMKAFNATQELSMRKTICRGSSTDLVYVLSRPASQFIYVAVCYTNEINCVTIRKVSIDDPTLGFSPLGDIWLTHSLTGKDWFVNIPSQFLNRITLRALLIKDVDLLLKDKDLVKFDLGTNKVKRDPNLIMVA